MTLENRKERIDNAKHELILPLLQKINKTPKTKRADLQRRLRNYEARAANALMHQTPIHLVHHEYLNYQNVPECLKILETMLRKCYETVASEDDRILLKRKSLDVKSVNAETGTVIISGDLSYCGNKEEQKEKWMEALRAVEEKMKGKGSNDDDDDEDDDISDEEGECLFEVKVNVKKERNEIKRIRQRRANAKKPCPEKASTEEQRMALKILYLGSVQGRVMWRTPYSREERVRIVNKLRGKYNSFVSPAVKLQLNEIMCEKTARRAIKDALGVGMSLAEGVAFIDRISMSLLAIVTTRH